MENKFNSKFSLHDLQQEYINRQKFSIPENIIYYISMNPKSSKVYQKLIQTCKYFFHKNSIIVVEQILNYENYEDSLNGFKMIYPFWEEERNKENIFDIEKLKFKIWITSYLDISELTNSKACSLLISKIYRCDINALRMDKQNISLEEFKILTASGTIKSIMLEKTNVLFSDGKIMPLEGIFEFLPNLKKANFYNSNESITFETSCKFAQIQEMSKIESIQIENLPEMFDFETFFDNLKKPFTTEFKFDYDESISDEFKEKLQSFINKMVETGVTESCPPLINFPGLSYESLGAQYKLKRDYNLQSYAKRNFRSYR